MNLIKPSFSTGYAKNASESANPNLWKGLVGAWMPSFGVTGREVVEVSGRNDNLVSQEPTDHIEWITGKHGKAFSTIDYSYADGGDVSAYIEDGLTVSGYFWMGRNGGTKMIVGQWGAGGVGNASWLVDCVQNKIVARTYNGSAGSAVNSASTMRYQEWQHVACVWNFNTSPFTVTIYFDGRYDAAGSFSSSIFPQVSTNYKVHVGTYPPSISSSTRTNLRWGGHYGDFTIYNRALSPTEIKQLYLNPSAPFQKKTTTVVSVPVAPPTTTAKAVVLKKPKPSYATGYAKNASESANPNLWKGLVGAWMPSFGVTGGEVKELTSKSPNLTLQNIPYSNWEVKDKSLAVMLEGNDDYLSGSYCDAVNFGYKSFAVTSHFYVTAYSAIEAMFDGRTSSSPYRGFHTYMRNSDRVQVQLRSSGALDQYLFTFTAIGGQLATDRIHSMSTVVDRQKATCTQYFNGIYIGSASISSGMTDINSNTDFRFGRNIVNQYPLTGGVASLLIHHRALNEKEVRTLHANRAAPFERKQRTVGISTSQAFNPYWANQATQLAGTLQ